MYMKNPLLQAIKVILLRSLRSLRLNSILLSSLLSASTVCAQSGVSEDPSPSPIRWESAGRSTLPRSTLSTNAPSRLNRFTAGYRMGYQMSVKFKALGGFPAQSDPGPATGTHQDHTYDDGYVVRDTRQVNDHYTWDWGFKSPTQVQPGQGTPYGSLLLHTAVEARGDWAQRRAAPWSGHFNGKL